jgi:hypothetical protein
MAIPSRGQARTPVTLRIPCHYATVQVFTTVFSTLFMACDRQERRRIAPSRIIKIHEFLACHIGMGGSRCVRTDLLNTPCLRLEDEPIDPTNDLGMVPVKSRPFQHRRASIHINEQVVHRPAHPLFPDDLRKIAPNGCCPCPFEAWWRQIMDRLRTEARGNRLGISIVACLDIRSDDVLHALHRRGLCRRGVPPCVQRGSLLTPRPRRQSGGFGETRCVIRVCSRFFPGVLFSIAFVGETHCRAYGTFSHTSTLPSKVAVILFPSKTTDGGAKGSLNWMRPPSTVTGALRV